MGLYDGMMIDQILFLVMKSSSFHFTLKKIMKIFYNSKNLLNQMLINNLQTPSKLHGQ